MTTPSRRSSTAILEDTGPSRSVLQQLLDEINGSVPERVHSSRLPSRPSSIRSNSRKDSVWVRGNSIAEEAREKLRAADQARQKWKHSDGNTTPSPEQPPQLRRHSTQSGMLQAYAQPQVLIQKAPTFDESDIASHATSSSQDGAPVSPATSDSISSLGKGQRSPFRLHGPLPKRPRVSPTHEHDLWTQCSKCCEPCTSAAVSRTSTFTERDPTRDDADWNPIALSRRPTLSSFRPIAATPQGHPEITTPIRNSPSLTPSSHPASPYATTPAWLKPFQLLDDGKSIFKNVHGEDSNEHPLCLHCFRGQGSFHRILQEGCEVCGREEVLKGHYWEQMVDTY